MGKFKKDDQMPSIEGIDELKSVMIFDEDYVNQYVYQKDEILKNSFDIFIKTPEYERHQAAILEQVKELKKIFENQAELDELLNIFSGFIGGFGKAASGYAKNGSIAKGIGAGNKLANIPEELSAYTDFLKHEPRTVTWLKWQMGGQTYSEHSRNCPYCANDIEDTKPVIKKISEEFDSKAIEHLINMLDVFGVLSEYFSPETNAELDLIAANVEGLSDEQIKYLTVVKNEVEMLKSKLENIKNLSFETLKDIEQVATEIESYKIDASKLVHLNSKNIVENVTNINLKIDKVLTSAWKIQMEVTQQNQTIRAAVIKYEEEINEFLLYAGFRYRVYLREDKDEKLKLTLSHINIDDEPILNARQHLSYGERNAFALVLFMYDAINQNPDLIILDDPISSFDGNKKFAILHKLFTGGRDASLFERTTVLFTHEFSTVIDVIHNLPQNFNAPQASFLENRRGILNEKDIKKQNIKSFNEIALDNIEISSHCLGKLIYLRRYLELQKDKTDGWQLLSNYFHKRDTPIQIDPISLDERPMTGAEIENGTKQINKYTPGFNYDSELSEIKDSDELLKKYELTVSNYEKLQIYRILKDIKDDDKVMQKFINETYHVENDYLFQLNPIEYEVIPDYIIDQCDKSLGLK